MMFRCPCLALCGVLFVASVAEAHRDVELQAAAGLDGIVKAARWVPVRIGIDNRGGAVTTELVVSWGDAIVTRRLSLAASARRDVEVYIRTAEPTGQMRVFLDSAPDRGVDVPVRVLPLDEWVTLCVTTPTTMISESARCSVTIPPERLPGSARGYDAVDDIETAQATRLLRPRLREALAQAHAIRQLDRAGDLALTSQVTGPTLRRSLPDANLRVIAAIAATYVALLLATGAFAAVRAPAPSFIWITAGALTVAATGAGYVVGRIGPGSRIHIHHSTLLQQLPTAPGAILTLRGVARFPAPDMFEVRLDLQDAMLEAAAASSRSPQKFDEDGRPLLAGRFGLGGRLAFSAEGFVDAQPLSVEEIDNRTIRITNRSPQSLTDCRFSFGFSVGEIGVLQPRQSVTASHEGDVIGPVFTCTMQNAPVAFFADDVDIATSGETRIAVYQRREAQVPEAPND